MRIPLETTNAAVLAIGVRVAIAEGKQDTSWLEGWAGHFASKANGLHATFENISLSSTHFLLLRAMYAYQLMRPNEDYLYLGHAVRTEDLGQSARNQVNVYSDDPENAMTINSTLACWDNPIRGLDSSSALEFLRLLKRMSRATGMTNVVTLYQASENMYQECFDRTIVMYEGRMIFSGKIAEAKRHFEDLGFHCPDRQTIPDFLTSIASPAERTIREDYRGPLYLDPDSLAQAFYQSSHYAQMQKEIAEYARLSEMSLEKQQEFHREVGVIQSPMALKQAVEPSKIWKQIFVGTRRYYRLFWGDRNTFFHHPGAV
ncbi:hypothetical protein N8T08_001881 [Aspergillus melleus]|uniref:Uncharacterized protein n=1 Tax=Aspergillus melleus TaxID=138277 RepID=A0ACC3B9R6_9EURO|nr:hypothetical protein N8T08_001881 [Aspergillus melleus]